FPLAPFSPAFPYTTLFRSLQSRDAHVEIGHRRGIDEAQAQLIAMAERAGPVARGAAPVHQVGVGVGVDVRQVGRGHAHGSPHAPDRKSTRLNSSHVKISYA